MRYDKSILKIYGAVLLVLVMGALLVQFGTQTPYRFTKEPIQTLNEQWTGTADGKTYDLPEILPASPGVPVAIERTLDDNFRRAQIVCIRGSLQSIRVYLDSDVIYENIQKNEGPIHSPKLSIWNMIQVPSGSEGKTLKIEFSTDIKSLTGHFGGVIYGSKGAVINHLAFVYGKDMPLVFLIFIFGLILTMVPLLFREYGKGDLIYLGLFSMAISMWFFSESKLLQFLTDNSWILGGMGCIMLALMPIPLMLYIRTAVATQTKRIFTVLAAGFAVDVVIVVSLQALGLVDLYESLIVTHLWFAVSALGTILCFIKEIRSYKNKMAVQFIKALMPLIFFAILEMFSFYLEDFHHIAFFSKIGLMFFLLVQAVDSLKKILAYVKKSSVADLYKKLAYEDRLTGAPNRMAFDQDLAQIFEMTREAGDCRLVIFDVNGLKGINDSYGHVSGDETLQISYEYIEKIFGKFGSCYRIGGDEFACICENQGDKAFRNQLNELQQALKKASEGKCHEVSVAGGSVVIDPLVDYSVSDFIHRADLEMYKDKNEFYVKSEKVTV